jgi:hypothetical protein
MRAPTVLTTTPRCKAARSVLSQKYVALRFDQVVLIVRPDGGADSPAEAT